jgi:alkanesulfonate monooxygenase SsuD/methylene tetrahydromethanopterin reductase-like flavin-dependent oxidoreductase (luciferase family)
VPTKAPAWRGSRYWDPLATFGFLPARTEHIRLATSVLVLGYHHPLEIGKRYGTLDLVSGGRLVLGVGVGTLIEEFDLLQAPFDDRGERADDSLRPLRWWTTRSRTTWSSSTPFLRSMERTDGPSGPDGHRGAERRRQTGMRARPGRSRCHRGAAARTAGDGDHEQPRRQHCGRRCELARRYPA